MKFAILESPREVFEKSTTKVPRKPKSVVKQKVYCVRCNKDVTREAGIRGQTEGSEYVCKACRDEEAANPVGIIENLLKNAVKDTRVPGAPSIKGYQIETIVGRGGMGIVYKAADVKTRQAVAIKTMLPDVATDPDSVFAFQREIDITRQLTHPNIVRLFEQGKAQGTFYFILEYVDGIDLAELLQSRGGQIPLDDAAPIMIGSLDGLAYAHHVSIMMEVAKGKTTTFTGIVHRDLKPQNILLQRMDEHWIPKLSDFGISKSFESAGLTDITAPGEVLGTPMYWPREQITHYKYLNPTTDVFSMAAVFYEMLTGKWVRGGFNELFKECKRKKRYPTIADYMNVIAKNPIVPIRKHNPSVPEPIAKVLDRALREVEIPHDQQKMRATLTKLRYPDARFFRDALVDAFQEASLVEMVNVTRQFTQNFQDDAMEQRVSTSIPVRLKAELLTGSLRTEQADSLKLKENESPISGEIMYSMGQPAAKKEVALFVLDLVQSTQFVLNVGDTYFSTLIGKIHKTAHNHASASEMLFLKSTGDGLLAVFQGMSAAFSLAATFLEISSSQDIRLRIALHWGAVKFGPDGDVLGREVHRVCRVEGVQSEEQVEPSGELSTRGTPNVLPEADRILVTSQGLEQLETSIREKFIPTGKFRLKGFQELTELWIFNQE